MDLNELLKNFILEVYPSNVTFLSEYKLERSKKYPGVGVRHFDKKYWHEHKQWLESESKRLARIEHNKRVSEEYRNPPKDPS